MEKGRRVKLPNGTGTIRNVITAVPGDSLPGSTGGRVVLKVYVQPDGVRQSYPVNAWELEEAA